MLIATFCLGDTLITLCRATSLDRPSDRMADTFNLTFSDIATDKLPYTYVIPGDRENDAMLTFAAAIAADEHTQMTGDMARLLSELYNSPAIKFLP